MKQKLPHILLVIIVVLSGKDMEAQVGINTTDPDVSSVLDIRSTEGGLLIPRMSTSEREAIVNPATSLLVFDIEENLYYMNQGTPSNPSWISFLSTNDIRDNHVSVKDVTDFPGGGQGGTIVLDENTIYEINGTVNISQSIDLNQAYLIGEDTREDVLNYTGSGALFMGSAGGRLRNLAFTGTSGSLFNLSASATEDLIMQDLVINNFSSVGTISGFGIVFSDIIEFYDNNDGIVYQDIGNLLIDDNGWLSSNSGAFETFQGTFGFIQKEGGFSIVPSGASGIDVSANPTVGDAVLEETVFSGDGNYIEGHPNSETYEGYSFTEKWTVNCPGLPKESDDAAIGNITLSAPVGSGVSTTFSSNGTSSRTKLAGTTSSTNLFRFEKVGNNRIRYKGLRTRYFQINGSMSYQATNDLTIILYVAKNGTVIENTKVYGRGPSGFFVNQGILALPITGQIELSTDDYIEIWAERHSGSGNILTVSLNVNVY